MLSEEFELLQCFHTLGDNLHVQTLTHAYDGADDTGVVSIRGEIGCQEFQRHVTV